jgi:hypothetical protein
MPDVSVPDGCRQQASASARKIRESELGVEKLWQSQEKGNATEYKRVRE